MKQTSTVLHCTDMVWELVGQTVVSILKVNIWYIYLTFSMQVNWLKDIAANEDVSIATR